MLKRLKNLNRRFSYRHRKKLYKLKKELDLNNMIVVTFIARLDEFKDPITFVRSVPHVLKQVQNVRFLLVGEGNLEGAVRDAIYMNGVEDVVKLMGKRDDIGNILSLSTIFVALSPIENIWSLTILEAIKCRVPCIVTNSGTTAEHLQHRIHAFLIEPKSEIDLSNAIIELICDTILREQLVENSLNLLDRSGFSSTHIVNSTISLYDNCLRRQ